MPFSGGFSLSEADSTDMAGHGYWAGVFYLITGFVGYSASYKPSKSMYDYFFLNLNKVQATRYDFPSPILILSDFAVCAPCHRYRDNTLTRVFLKYLNWNRLVATLVLSAFSILTGIAATSLSGMTGGNVWSTRLCRYYDSDTGEYITDYHVCM